MSSLSTKLLPTFIPRASKKVFAIAPPIATTSAILINLSSTDILSAILAPPTIAIRGLTGSDIAVLIVVTSFSRSKPATLGNSVVIASVDACALCTTPNPS